VLDQKIPARPRVALVFGDPGSASHLRDAVSNHVDIVYETSAADFDASRMAAAQATAALVNLDDCAPLDDVETRLHEAGVAVVFNDPEISGKLEGWARARWLRHLAAKLSGSSDFDPPRPIVAQAMPVVAEAVSSREGLSENETPVADDALQVVERPLSPAEIESMTANFSAVQEVQSPAPEHLEMEAELPAAVAPIETPHMSPATLADGHENADALDVDTEALSAMIDARLAAAAGEPEPESPAVWREIDGGNVAAIELSPEAADAEPAVASAAAPVDDADVLKALPSLDDWQLVDPDVPVAPAAGSKNDDRASPALSIDFAGLELVPVETVVPVASNSEPIERWMHVASDNGGAAGNALSSVKSEGERA
jgi:two-component system chemotaxis response regulator CheB/chemosensory pili system protein ChpB (putative protein-glutamate methylesterase)